jgi:serine/threonine-protein kinase RsbW
MGKVTVSVPALPDYVHVLRSVVAAVAARSDFSYDAIEDLRLAVDEASAQLLAFGRGATSIRVEIDGAGDAAGLEVIVSSDAQDVAGWPPEGAERTLTWQVLTALADSARFEVHEGAPALRLTKRREAAGAR